MHPFSRCEVDGVVRFCTIVDPRDCGFAGQHPVVFAVPNVRDVFVRIERMWFDYAVNVQFLGHLFPLSKAPTISCGRCVHAYHGLTKSQAARST